MSNLLRDLPAVHAVVADPRLADVPPPLAAALARDVLAEVRSAVRSGAIDAVPDVVARVEGRARRLLQGRLRPVFNATGVVLHTNLGRAPWSEAARRAAVRAMGTCNLEIDLSTGGRGERLAAIEAQCRALIGCEAAIAVNNGAAALLLALTALARGREVLVSRGELVEIGGSFRVPEIIAAGGARMVEVGTTNRTRTADYTAAAGPDTAVLLSVHPSNFRILGFTATPTRRERVAVARALGVAVVEDVGSGALTGGHGEPSVRDAVAAGVDVVVFSGDKLLGGPQAGLAVGRREAIAALRRHPLYRALRLDKVALAALEATLAGRLAGERLPVDAMLEATPEALKERAEELRRLLAEKGVRADLVRIAGTPGGGTGPGVVLPGWGVRVGGPAQGLARRLRVGTPAVVARICDGSVVLDPRTLPPGDLPTVARAVAVASEAGYEAGR